MCRRHVVLVDQNVASAEQWMYRCDWQPARSAVAQPLLCPYHSRTVRNCRRKFVAAELNMDDRIHHLAAPFRLLCLYKGMHLYPALRICEIQNQIIITIRIRCDEDKKVFTWRNPVHNFRCMHRPIPIDHRCDVNTNFADSNPNSYLCRQQRHSNATATQHIPECRTNFVKSYLFAARRTFNFSLYVGWAILSIAATKKKQIQINNESHMHTIYFAMERR